LSYSKPKPSPTPQIVFFGWYTRLWLHLMLLSEPQMKTAIKQATLLYIVSQSIFHTSFPLILSLEAEVELYHSVHGENLV